MDQLDENLRELKGRVNARLEELLIQNPAEPDVPYAPKREFSADHAGEGHAESTSHDRPAITLPQVDEPTVLLGINPEVSGIGVDSGESVQVSPNDEERPSRVSTSERADGHDIIGETYESQVLGDLSRSSSHAQLPALPSKGLWSHFVEFFRRRRA